MTNDLTQRLKRLHELLDGLLGMGLEPEDDAAVLEAKELLVFSPPDASQIQDYGRGYLDGIETGKARTDLAQGAPAVAGPQGPPIVAWRADVQTTIVPGGHLVWRNGELFSIEPPTSPSTRNIEPLVRFSDACAALASQGAPAEQPTGKPVKFVVGGKYNWRNQPDRLIYLGKKGAWHQFKKIGDPREVWCEVLDEDLRMIEETKP